MQRFVVVFVLFLIFSSPLAAQFNGDFGVTRAGQPGMGVARTMAMDSEIAVIGFSRNGTDHPDAFVIINIAANDKKVAVKVQGGAGKTCAAFRTSDDEKDLYAPIGYFELDDNDVIFYTAPARSAATFYAP